MNFHHKLNEYMERLSCTARELCSLSGISAASFSRYRNGERVPELGTKPFEGLCSTIAQIAAQKESQTLRQTPSKRLFLPAKILYRPTRRFSDRTLTRFLPP